MKILKIISNTFKQAYYNRALAEINPTHADVPRIVRRRMELQDEARKLFA